MEKHYLTAQQLLEDSWRLAARVLNSNFNPTWLIGIWRGGTPVAIAMHELFVLQGHPCHNGCIKTSLYTGINRTGKTVAIEGMDPLLEQMSMEDRVLLVDDVYDTGQSLSAVVGRFHEVLEDNCPTIRIATPWFKPDNNRTDITPDYYLHQTAKWLVFPHELEGLTKSEILQQKPGADVLRQILEP